MNSDQSVAAIRWQEGSLQLLDQRLLPEQESICMLIRAGSCRRDIRHGGERGAGNRCHRSLRCRAGSAIAHCREPAGVEAGHQQRPECSARGTAYRG